MPPEPYRIGSGGFWSRVWNELLHPPKVIACPVCGRGFERWAFHDCPDAPGLAVYLR
jgi:hypothetical protein